MLAIARKWLVTRSHAAYIVLGAGVLGGVSSRVLGGHWLAWAVAASALAPLSISIALGAGFRGQPAIVRLQSALGKLPWRTVRERVSQWRRGAVAVDGHLARIGAAATATRLLRPSRTSGAGSSRPPRDRAHPATRRRSPRSPPGARRRGRGLRWSARSATSLPRDSACRTRATRGPVRGAGGCPRRRPRRSSSPQEARRARSSCGSRRATRFSPRCDGRWQPSTQLGSLAVSLDPRRWGRSSVMPVDPRRASRPCEPSSKGAAVRGSWTGVRGVRIRFDLAFMMISSLSP